VAIQGPMRAALDDHGAARLAMTKAGEPIFNAVTWPRAAVQQ